MSYESSCVPDGYHRAGYQTGQLEWWFDYKAGTMKRMAVKALLVLVLVLTVTAWDYDPPVAPMLAEAWAADVTVVEYHPGHLPNTTFSGLYAVNYTLNGTFQHYPAVASGADDFEVMEWRNITVDAPTVGSAVRGMDRDEWQCFDRDVFGIDIRQDVLQSMAFVRTIVDKVSVDLYHEVVDGVSVYFLIEQSTARPVTMYHQFANGSGRTVKFSGYKTEVDISLLYNRDQYCG